MKGCHTEWGNPPVRIYGGLLVMRIIRRTIAGLEVVMEPIEQISAVYAGAATFVVKVEGVPLIFLTHSDHEGHPHWYCDCGKERSSRKDPMLAHVVAKHSRIYSLVTVDNGLTFEARTTYQRLAGKHADPTYEQAMHHMYGSSW